VSRGRAGRSSGRRPARSAGPGVGRRSGPRPPARLQITDRGRPRCDRAFLRNVVRAALRYGGAEQMPVSLLLTDDREIAQIHGRFLGDPTPTDVISFLLDGAAEVVVSVETAARCAGERGHALRAELALYVVHGLLHQCGFDDVQARARARMRRAEREVLAALGIALDGEHA
jgi:probable rRNA maturation factor